VSVFELACSPVYEDLLAAAQGPCPSGRNWFDVDTLFRLYSLYIALDQDTNGMLSLRYVTASVSAPILPSSLYIPHPRPHRDLQPIYDSCFPVPVLARVLRATGSATGVPRAELPEDHDPGAEIAGSGFRGTVDIVFDEQGQRSYATYTELDFKGFTDLVLATEFPSHRFATVYWLRVLTGGQVLEDAAALALAEDMVVHAEQVLQQPPYEEVRTALHTRHVLSFMSFIRFTPLFPFPSPARHHPARHGRRHLPHVRPRRRRVRHTFGSAR
jgi:hypothetical protein